MKAILKVVLILAVAFAVGCTDREREAEKAKQDAAAKARADAAKKEMETLPKVFSTPDYYKKNEPAKPSPGTPAKTEPSKK